MAQDKKTFRALVVRKEQDGSMHSGVENLPINQLPEGDVTVSVDCSSLNYKDGLCLGSGGGLVRSWPHVPGIDLAGIVEHSNDPRYKPGDNIIVTGWGTGERHWGGYASKARLAANWLVPMPDGMDSHRAMEIGTAGLTAMLALIALERHGLTPNAGDVLITGASGGVGSVAVALLAGLGYQVTAVTGRPDNHSYLTELGAKNILNRQELTENNAKPMEKALWAGCIDSAGGNGLRRALAQMQYGASVAAIGLAASAEFNASLIPFLLRGVNLLGIDSVMQPFDSRTEAWKRLVTDLPAEKLKSISRTAPLDDLPQLGKDILQGKIRGRVVIDVNA